MIGATNTIADQAGAMKLLSDETRLRTLVFLKDGEKNVTEICGHLGQSQPAVSHHLALLRVSGLVGSRREGKHNYYSIQRGRLKELTSVIGEIAGRAKRKGA